jgi:hypothetical protein
VPSRPSGAGAGLRRWRLRRVVGRVRACWAVTREEAPGRGFLRSGLCFFLFGGFCVPIWFGLVGWYPVCSRLFNTPSLSLFKTWTAPRRSPDTTTTTTTGINATDQLLVSTTSHYAHLSPLLLRARGALQTWTAHRRSPDNTTTTTTGGRWATPCASPLLLGPRAFAPTPAARVLAGPVSGVGLGLFCMRFLLRCLPQRL